MAEIESAVEWFKHNEEKLHDCMIEIWNVAEEEKHQLSHLISNETKRLERYFRIHKPEKIPEDVLTRIREHLKPYIVDLG